MNLQISEVSLGQGSAGPNVLVFDSQLRLPLTLPRALEVVVLAPAAGSLPLTSETWTQFQAPGFSLPEVVDTWVVSQQTGTLSVCAE